MDKMTINVPDGHEIDLTKSNLSKGEIYFKKLESKYPLSVKEIEGRDWTIVYGRAIPDVSEDLENVSTESRAKAFLALMQLVELRDAWNKVDGFVPDWSGGNVSYCIVIVKNVAEVQTYFFTQKTLHFKSQKTADLFFNTFKDLVEEAKELL